jgi:hypothetical protein
MIQAKTALRRNRYTISLATATAKYKLYYNTIHIGFHEKLPLGPLEDLTIKYPESVKIRLQLLAVSRRPISLGTRP